MKQDQKQRSREGMEYNSDRDNLIIPEYGRHVQKMIFHAKTIEKREDRQFFMDMVVQLMGQIVPDNKPSIEVANKLWNHALMIANYEIEVDVPEGVDIVNMAERPKPKKLDYPQRNMKFRHYGANVQKLMDKAKQLEDDPEKKEIFANAIGSYMKMAYRTWHNDQYVNDEVIKGDLKAMSKGDLDLSEEVALDFLGNMPIVKKQGSGGKKHNNGHKRGRSKGKSKRRR